MTSTRTHRTHRTRTARRLVLSSSLVVVLGLGVVACGGGDDSDTSSKASTDATTTTVASGQNANQNQNQGNQNQNQGNQNQGNQNQNQNNQNQNGNQSAAPVINSFSTPENIDCHNGNLQNFTASWTTTNAVKVTISIDGPGVYNTYGPNGDTSLPFNCSSSHTFLLTAFNSAGATVTKSITLQPRNVQTQTSDDDTTTTQP